MSILGASIKLEITSRYIIAKNKVAVTNINGVEAISLQNDEPSSFVYPVKMDKLKSNICDQVHINANLKTNYGAGYIKSDEHGVLSSGNPSTSDIILVYGAMIAGNANNVGKENTVIKCKGGTGEDKIKCVGINAKPHKYYSLVVVDKGTLMQNLFCKNMQIR